MAGSTVAFSTARPGQPFRRTLSSTVNEVDVLTPPAWASRYALYMSAAGRVSVEPSGSKTTASVGADTDAHSPVPATTWVVDALPPPDEDGAQELYISSSTGSAVYYIKFYSESRSLM